MAFKKETFRHKANPQDSTDKAHPADQTHQTDSSD
jgi:hypothetical protein